MAGITMWSFGYSVREIERSHHHVIIEETATTGAVWLFGGCALLTLVLWVTKPRPSESTVATEAVVAFTVLFFALIALWASVRSTFTADRASNQLIIVRRILSATVRNVYDAHTIDRVDVRNTRKGSGLYVRFKSGRSKSLSMSLGTVPLEAFSIALNSTLDTGHKR